MFIPIENALRRFRDGEMLILMDAEHRENEGDLVIAANHASADSINFMITHGRGMVCVPLTEARARELDLRLMCAENAEVCAPRFTVTVDARDGVTTGISSYDRARTIRALLDRTTRAQDLSRPGHVFPLIARDGGVLERAGHTEAAVDLARLGGLEPMAVLCEILNEDGTVARLPQLESFSKAHGLPIVRIDDLIDYRTRSERRAVAGEPIGVPADRVQSAPSKGPEERS